MKIGVISDTHSLLLPKKLLEELSKVDLIIHAGDVCDKETLKTLRNIKELKAVQGNMCDSDVKQRLPLKEYVECEGIHIGVYHGHGSAREALTNAQEQFKGEALDIIIFGHSHQAFNKTIDGTLYFNPGSPNDVVRAPFFSYGLIEIRNGKIKAEISKL
ncbi:MAG: metallophosphoesterase family protein [Candidatus Omnitrophica bacterium]|nr:metallophosphoesterase family protein [Candidatus Omnitrophota bacterium]